MQDFVAVVDIAVTIVNGQEKKRTRETNFQEWKDRVWDTSNCARRDERGIGWGAGKNVVVKIGAEDGATFLGRRCGDL